MQQRAETGLGVSKYGELLGQVGPLVEGHKPEIDELRLALEKPRFGSQESIGGSTSRDGIAVSMTCRLEMHRCGISVK